MMAQSKYLVRLIKEYVTENGIPPSDSRSFGRRETEIYEIHSGLVEINERTGEFSVHERGETGELAKFLLNLPNDRDAAV